MKPIKVLPQDLEQMTVAELIEYQKWVDSQEDDYQCRK